MGIGDKCGGRQPVVQALPPFSGVKTDSKSISRKDPPARGWASDGGHITHDIYIYIDVYLYIYICRYILIYIYIHIYICNYGSHNVLILDACPEGF